MAPSPLLAPFESLVNRTIAASTPAREILKTLAGKAFAIEFATPLGGPMFRLRLVALESSLAVGSGGEPADATVSGTPLALAALLAGGPQGRASVPGITIAGEAEVAQAFEELFRHARPDLEEELARLVGDAPAHYAGRAVRAALSWAGRARDSLARSVGEYLTEESRDLVARAELDVLLGGIDRIREDLDRAEARLGLLERRTPTRARAP
ncbi:MAG TPA: SCP2 sterol-binding domain-containing protein [Steroidobacteraceae bacterium]|nr:SCP2 sterol-binding domain-containing protein [Steroidobacteraceae bacterium]